MNYQVSYVARNGQAGVTTVEVKREIEGQCFYAKQLGLWGCGKMASTPEDAIRMLVQDMATIISIGVQTF